ncbi:RecB family exonuclease [Glutamicibacter ardleyensis]|uniref:RecB family exonuclease n=1 Tax=Glutamicibacter ardleyensis TaxID=225894 RepID=UPI003FD03A7C
MNATIEANKEATETPFDLKGRVAWEGNCLKVVDEVSLERIQRHRMSPSTSQSLESGACASKWAVGYLLPRDESPLEPAPLGTDTHQLLEDLYSLAPSKRTQATFYDLLDKLTDAKREAGQMSESELGEWRNKILHMAGKISAMENPQHVIVYSNEITLKEMMPGVKTAPDGIPFTGSADRVDIEVDAELGKLVRKVLPAHRAETYFGTVFDVEFPDGDMLGHLADDLFDALPKDAEALTAYLRELEVNLSLVIIDYKTGKSRGWQKHLEQVISYALAFKERTGLLPKAGKVYYTTEGHIRDVVITQESADKVLTKLGASWKRHNRFISLQEFPTKATPLCGWCPLVNACPRASVEGKSARKAGLPTNSELAIPSLEEHMESVRNSAPAEQSKESSNASESGEVAGASNVSARVGNPLIEPGHPTAVPGMHVAVVRVPERFEKEPKPVLAVVEAQAEKAIRSQTTETGGEQKIFVRRAHIEGMNTQTQPNKVARAYKEAPQYSTFIPTANGSTPVDVNPSSFAMTAGFSLTTMAMKVLTKQGEQITRQRVASLSGTFAHVVNIAHDQWIPGQAQVREGEKMGLHSHARLRGALMAVVEEFPFPLHGNLDEMNAWVAHTIKRVLFTIQSAEDLVKFGSGKNPWELLVATEQED